MFIVWYFYVIKVKPTKFPQLSGVLEILYAKKQLGSSSYFGNFEFQKRLFAEGSKVIGTYTKILSVISVYK